MLTYLASALLVASVVMRGIAVSRPPWGNMFEFATAAAAAVGVAYSVLARRNRWEWLGVFIVTPILLVLGLSLTVLYTEAGELMPALKSYWLGIHVSVAFLAVAFFTLAFAIGVLYLVRLRREEKPPAKPGVLESLPSAAALERTAYSLNMVGFILWTFTLIAGAIWAKQAWGAYWQWDPKEVWTFVIWTVYAAYMHGRATAGVDPRKSMYIALAGYVAVIINFTLVNLVSTFVGMHNYSGMS
jgi:cytochrome c-type biogenesis protein CcsB